MKIKWCRWKQTNCAFIALYDHKFLSIKNLEELQCPTNTVTGLYRTREQGLQEKSCKAEQDCFGVPGQAETSLFVYF
jgi:hypothetical protein